MQIHFGVMFVAGRATIMRWSIQFNLKTAVANPRTKQNNDSNILDAVQRPYHSWDRLWTVVKRFWTIQRCNKHAPRFFGKHFFLGDFVDFFFNPQVESCRICFRTPLARIQKINHIKPPWECKKQTQQKIAGIDCKAHWNTFCRLICFIQINCKIYVLASVL